MRPSEVIRDYVLGSCGMDSVGFAPAIAFDAEPEGQRPGDVLPGAATVIVFTKRISDGAVQAAFRYHEDSNQDALSIYGAFGCDMTPNMSLFFAEFDISEFVERNFGYTCVPVPVGPNQNVTPVNCDMPIFVGPLKFEYILHPDRAAVAAGLGELGWNNLLITPENGPRQQIGIIVTSMELDYDRPYDGPRLCDPESCHVCSDVCPMSAVPAYGGESDDTSVAGKPVSCAHINSNACAVASMAFRSEFAPKGKVPDLILNDNPSDEELAQAYASKPFSANTIDHFPKHYCNKCMLYCPVGRWKERFVDRGLTTYTVKG